MLYAPRVCKTRVNTCITQTNDLQRTDKWIDDEYYYSIRSIHTENYSISITIYVMTLRYYTNKDERLSNSGLMKYYKNTSVNSIFGWMELLQNIKMIAELVSNRIIYITRCNIRTMKIITRPTYCKRKNMY